MLKLTDAELANLRLQAWRVCIDRLGSYDRACANIQEHAEVLLKWLLQPRSDGE